MKQGFDLNKKAQDSVNNSCLIDDYSDVYLAKGFFKKGAHCMKEEVIKQLHILVGAMILDGYDEYDACVKYVNEYIKELEKC